MRRPLYQQFAVLLQAKQNCLESGNTEWYHKHSERIWRLGKDHLPSGSGLDRTPYLDQERSTPERLVIVNADFHHMDAGGMYDGWTVHAVTVTPSLANVFDVRISGRNRNDVKPYLHETFSAALRQEVEP
jgi:hypothetical protein